MDYKKMIYAGLLATLGYASDLKAEATSAATKYDSTRLETNIGGNLQSNVATSIAQYPSAATKPAVKKKIKKVPFNQAATQPIAVQEQYAVDLKLLETVSDYPVKPIAVGKGLYARNLEDVVEILQYGENTGLFIEGSLNKGETYESNTTLSGVIEAYTRFGNVHGRSPEEKESIENAVKELTTEYLRSATRAAGLDLQFSPEFIEPVFNPSSAYRAGRLVDLKWTKKNTEGKYVDVNGIPITGKKIGPDSLVSLSGHINLVRGRVPLVIPTRYLKPQLIEVTEGKTPSLESTNTGNTRYERSNDGLALNAGVSFGQHPQSLYSIGLENHEKNGFVYGFGVGFSGFRNSEVLDHQDKNPIRERRTGRWVAGEVTDNFKEKANVLRLSPEFGFDVGDVTLLAEPAVDLDFYKHSDTRRERQFYTDNDETKTDVTNTIPDSNKKGVKAVFSPSVRADVHFGKVGIGASVGARFGKKVEPFVGLKLKWRPQKK